MTTAFALKEELADEVDEPFYSSKLTFEPAVAVGYVEHGKLVIRHEIITTQFGSNSDGGRHLPAL